MPDPAETTPPGEGDRESAGEALSARAALEMALAAAVIPATRRFLQALLAAATGRRTGRPRPSTPASPYASPTPASPLVPDITGLLGPEAAAALRYLSVTDVFTLWADVTAAAARPIGHAFGLPNDVIDTTVTRALTSPLLAATDARTHYLATMVDRFQTRGPVPLWGFAHANRILTQAVAEGWSKQRIEDEMRRITDIQSFGPVTETMIRTESTAAFGSSTLVRLAEEGWPSKQWVSRRDERVRTTHTSADGQVQPLEYAFQVGGSSLMYPGDTHGPAKETHNCRCVVIGVGSQAQGYTVPSSVMEAPPSSFAWSPAFATPAPAP